MPDPYLQFPIARFPFCTSNHRVCAAVSTLHIDHLRDTVEENKFAVDPWGTPWRRITLPSACQLSEHSSWAPRIYRKKRALQGLTTLESTRCLKEAVYLLSSVRSKWFQAYDLFAIMQWRMFLPITHAANDVPTNYTCNEKFIVVLSINSGKLD